MPGKTPEELVAEARKLEDDAAAEGEDTARGRELRQKAAGLLTQALGPKSYPVIICSSCYRVTGWVAGDGQCHGCLRSSQTRAAYSDPHGGWVAISDERQAPPKPPSLPLGTRLAALAGRRGGLERATAEAWLTHVDPDATGPIRPEDGYELEGVVRDEVPAADGSGIVIRFSTARRRFANGAWARLESTKIRRDDILVPTEFSAGLPMEQLAEAWADYQAGVETFNRATWAAQSEAREADRQAREAQQQTLQEQRHTSDLLGG